MQPSSSLLLLLLVTLLTLGLGYQEASAAPLEDPLRLTKGGNIHVEKGMVLVNLTPGVPHEAGGADQGMKTSAGAADAGEFSR